MRKTELLRLQQPKVTDEMSKLADLTQKRYGGKEERRYKILMSIEVIGGILKTAIFFTEQVHAGVETPAYIVFFNKEEDQFLTNDLLQRKWRTCLIENLDGIYPSYDDDIYISPKDEQTIKDFFDTGDSGYYAMIRYQRDVLYRRRIRREKRLTGVWDEKMKQVPKLPKNWMQWVRTTGIAEHYIFYTYQKSGATEGYCTHCQRWVSIHKPKYNAKGSCSHCGHPIQYKSIGRFGRIITERVNVQLMQRCASGIILRKFMAYAVYDQQTYQEPKVCCIEEDRIFYDREWNEERYYYGSFKQRELRWIAGERYTNYYMKYYTARSYGRIYNKNLPYIGKKELKRTGFLQVLKKMEVNPEYYLAAFKKRPILEKLIKADLYQLTQEVLWDNTQMQFKSDSSLAKALEINKDQLKRLRKMNGGILALNWLQYEKRSNKNISDDVIVWFQKSELDPDKLSFILDRMSPLQVKNYLIRQAEQYDESIRGTLTTWKDYLSMAEKCGHDVEDEIIYRTSKLFKRHQDLVDKMVQLKRLERVREVLAQFPNVQRILLEIKEKYAYEDKEYAIIVPKSIEEICREGETLHHCVGSSDNYFAKIHSKEAYILFLRKMQHIDLPYYTLEVEPDGTIRQKQTGYGREKKDIQSVQEFLTRWQREVRMRIGKEEKKLASASKRARMQELKMLREKHAVIQGGIYDGELAADVLEADVMEFPDAA